MTSSSQFQIDVMNTNKGTRAEVGNLAAMKDASSLVRHSSMLLLGIFRILRSSYTL